MNLLMDRRHFAKCAGRFLACALLGGGYGIGKYSSEVDSDDPILNFIDLGLKFGSPDEVAAAFARADSAFLMASYAVFFPELLRRYGSDSVKELQDAARRQKKLNTPNHHRLDALPSVAAAHQMRKTTAQETRQELSKTILQGLTDPRREVREIVLQNLTTSVAPDYDSIRFFSTSPEVLAQLRRIVAEASENERLLSTALQCAEFLLNARALLLSRNASSEELSPYNETIEFARSNKAPHMWYVPLLIQQHEATFKATEDNIASLPPQSSEALMGWRNLDGARNYLSILALARARLVHTLWRTSSGRLAHDTSMSVEEANIALPKLLSFFTAFEFDWLLRGSSVADLVSAREPKFSKFLQSDFKQLIRRPELLGISVADNQIEPKMLRLRNLVPFAQYGEMSLFSRALQEKDANFRRAQKDAVFEGTKGAFTVASTAALCAWLFGRDAKYSPTPEAIEASRADLQTREKAMDDGKYKGVDEQQANLGDIDWRKFGRKGGR
jgi:hypothetical protein